MVLGSAALKLISTILYVLEFCCAGIIVAIYGYFLSVLADRNEFIPKWEEATIGISGGIVLYTVFAILLTCFLGGKVRPFYSDYCQSKTDIASGCLRLPWHSFQHHLLRWYGRHCYPYPRRRRQVLWTGQHSSW